MFPLEVVGCIRRRKAGGGVPRFALSRECRAKQLTPGPPAPYLLRDEMSDEPRPNIIRNLSGPIDRDAKQPKRESAAFIPAYSDKAGLEAVYEGLAMLLADDEAAKPNPPGKP